MLDRYPAAVIRYLFLQTGYRKPSNFTTESIEAAGKGLRGLYVDLEKLRGNAKAPASAPASDIEEFNAFLDDDLNTAGAVGWLQTYIKGALKAGADAARAAQVVATVEESLERLGLPPDAERAGVAPQSSQVKLNHAARIALSIIAGERDAPDIELVEKVVALRDKARLAKDWKKSDTLRDALSRAGIAVKDTAQGTQWSVDGGS
jgi:cysteinyl-tRNA synthetase